MFANKRRIIQNKKKKLSNNLRATKLRLKIATRAKKALNLRRPRKNRNTLERKNIIIIRWQNSRCVNRSNKYKF